MTQFQSVLDGLVERLGNATGPDRELDVALEVAFPYSPDISHSHRPASVRGKVTCRYNSGSSGTYNASHYTSSIDDALRLVGRVLPGWRYDIHSPRMGQTWEAVLMDGDSASRKIVVGHAASAPLAILLSALKSLESL